MVALAAGLSQPGLAKEKTPVSEAYSAEFDSLFFQALRFKNAENLEGALYAFSRCYDLYPNSAIVNYELGKLHLEHNNINSGLNFLKRAAKLDPKTIITKFLTPNCWSTSKTSTPPSSNTKRPSNVFRTKRRPSTS